MTPTRDEVEAIAEQQREFALEQLAAEALAGVETPLSDLLSGCALALIHFHEAADKRLEQGRIAWLIKQAESIAPADLAEPLAFLRRRWSTSDARDVIAHYRNKDLANMLRGLELVARMRSHLETIHDAGPQRAA